MACYNKIGRYFVFVALDDINDKIGSLIKSVIFYKMQIRYTENIK